MFASRTALALCCTQPHAAKWSTSAGWEPCHLIMCCKCHLEDKVAYLHGAISLALSVSVSASHPALELETWVLLLRMSDKSLRSACWHLPTEGILEALKTLTPARRRFTQQGRARHSLPSLLPQFWARKARLQNPHQSHSPPSLASQPSPSSEQRQWHQLQQAAVRPGCLAAQAALQVPRAHKVCRPCQHRGREKGHSRLPSVPKLRRRLWPSVLDLMLMRGRGLLCWEATPRLMTGTDPSPVLQTSGSWAAERACSPSVWLQGAKHAALFQSPLRWCSGLGSAGRQV